eukprot:scaffold320826_cov53-Attheya_sp.AAC.2
MVQRNSNESKMKPKAHKSEYISREKRQAYCSLSFLSLAMCCSRSDAFSTKSVTRLPLLPTARHFPIPRSSRLMMVYEHGNDDSENDIIEPITQASSFDFNESYKEWKKKYLPPLPEDQLVLSGDVASLFLYSFLDHTMNDLYVSMKNTPDVASQTFASALDPSLLGDMAPVSQLPVWFDPVHSAFGPLLTAALPVEHIVYAPAIASAGLSAVVMTSCWLISGYVNEAFSFRNTLGCTTMHALFVTLRTWILATFMLVVVAVGSDTAMGILDSVGSPSIGGLTQADADYIFDSFSVLVVWRFIFNSMLGYGK